MCTSVFGNTLGFLGGGRKGGREYGLFCALGQKEGEKKNQIPHSLNSKQGLSFGGFIYLFFNQVKAPTAWRKH